MIEWVHVILLASFAGLIVVLILILVLQRCFRPKTRPISDSERGRNFQNGLARLHQVSPHHLDKNGSKKPNNNYYVVRKGAPPQPSIFSWADHPSLVADAVENGWPRFAFTTFTSSPSVKSTRSILSGVSRPGTASNHHGNDHQINVEIGWEVCEGSLDYLQKIRLNPGLKKLINNTGLNSSTGAACVIRAALPLPGPHLGSSCFPQEAYFEITILPEDHEQHHLTIVMESESEKMKLVEEDFNAKNSLDCSTTKTSSHSRGRSKIDENEGVLVSVGLTGGGPLPLKIPGSFQGSVGFNSTGSVYLDGTKLVLESEKDEWGKPEKVIGCGYNPGQRRVFFTVDSQVVREIHCKTENFGSPLYPTLAANADVTVLVNFGQSPFKFAPANSQRTANPCFILPQENSPALGYEDSKELFSMGRIDSQWLQRSATRNNNTVTSIKSVEFDQESEGDLFEIVLDRSGTGRSPYPATYQCEKK